MSWLPDFIKRETPTFPAHVRLKHNTRARRMNLRLNTKTGVFDLTLPPHACLHQARSFVSQNEHWMNETLKTRPDAIPFTHQQILPLFGQNRHIQITPNESSARTLITLTPNALNVRTHMENPTPRITTFLKRLAKTEFTRIAKDKAQTTGKTLRTLIVRDPQSRWGSCSEDGRIMLSWRLIFAPPHAMDYVIAHEVAHLTHLNHSPAFWSLCRSLSHTAAQGEHWMKTKGNSLMRYGSEG